MMKYIQGLFLLLVCCVLVQAQAPEKLSSGEIYQKLKKLNFLGSVLYVAAHPDDENTRLISYFSNAVHANTAYLSLTRGDGGQNLIGPEIREMLGVMRTQELLQARSIDGGKQFFSRANDFGYSKHPDETFAIWNKEEVLADVVWTIRKFRPDIIVNRFDHRTPGRTHGHHTGSAMLSYEAFEMTGDRNVYPEQLEHVEVWDTKRLFFNTSWWFYGSRDNFEKADKSNLLSVDAGVYFPLIGKSNTEIAAEARSMHKCQGFGSMGSRGSQSEYMEFLKGDRPSKMEDPFEGINTTWTRVKGGEKIAPLLTSVIENFDFDDPSASVRELLLVRNMIKALKDEHWKVIKLDEVDQIIKQCLGAFAEVSVGSPSASPGEEVEAQIEVINRSNASVVLKSINLNSGEQVTMMDSALLANIRYQSSLAISVPKEASFSSPYWLNRNATLGMYEVKDQLLRGQSENQRPYSVQFDFEVEGSPYSISSPVVYKTSDPVKGEVYKPFEIIPEFSVGLMSDVFIFPDSESKEIEVVVKAGRDNVEGKLELCHHEGWVVSPKNHEVKIAKKGAEEIFKFELRPPDKQTEDYIVPLLRSSDSVAYTNTVSIIEYDHIPTQTIVKDASAKVVKLDIQIRGRKVAYNL